VTSQPAGPFVLADGQSQASPFPFPHLPQFGIFPIQIAASGGAISHAASLGLTINPVITTSEDSTMIFLDARTSTDATRLGLLKAWVLPLTEVSLNGTNYVKP